MSGLTDISGFRVGHAHDIKAATGCTVVLCPEEGAAGGMVITGGSTSTRQVGGLTPGHVVDRVHAILFTGGSGFGLDAASGVVNCLEERGIGFDVGVTKVPSVPTAALFDLRLGDHTVRPGPEMGRQACLAASDGEIAQGSVGAGCGATVGKLKGIEQATKGGLGTASIKGRGGLIVAGLVALNSFGDIRHHETGEIIAGARTAPDSMEFVDTEAHLLETSGEVPHAFRNTTLALVATNAKLNRSGCIRMAQAAAQGLARVIRPYGTIFDGDLVFALSHGELEADIHTLGLMGGLALAKAVNNAVMEADGLGLIPAYQDLKK